ncbi:endoribonuclease SymE [Lelliottia amnigena]|uniref:Endoribonuclease SymE n=1 Tax=Lelliottia amnigena TaxID=61646 RepID=A0AAP2EZI1_LELAM|nr:endoribonuclease SymE [Lelliottia amnigena]MBL5898863.1 endoribonuclease SymE [Lelliottia amnigena]MBL5934396.1 endoribonuclease SymE [Lelliottia amnigena]TCD11337.1 endoribonuclease SymE [Lelliottia amnigena]
MTNVDCIADSLEPEVFDVDTRLFTVSYASRFHDHARIPAFIMKGYWLDSAGFSTGTKVDVKIMRGCMVLTAREPEPEETEMEKLVHEVSKMSLRKQKQVMDFVGVISTKSMKS